MIRLRSCSNQPQASRARGLIGAPKANGKASQEGRRRWSTRRKVTRRLALLVAVAYAATVAPGCSSSDSDSESDSSDEPEQSGAVYSVDDSSAREVWDQIERLDPNHQRLVIGLDPSALNSAGEELASDAVQEATEELFDDIDGLRSTFTPEP